MGNQEVPNNRLKRFGVRSYSRGIDNGDEYAGIRDLRSIASIPTNNATYRGTDLARVVESTDEVGTDVFPRISAADRKHKNHVRTV